MKEGKVSSLELFFASADGGAIYGYLNNDFVSVLLSSRMVYLFFQATCPLCSHNFKHGNNLKEIMKCEQ